MNIRTHGAALARALACVVTAASMACSSGSGSDSGGGGSGGDGGGSIGVDIDRSRCREDVHCPIGYVCVAERCVIEFADRDNDGYTTQVDCNDTNGGIHPGTAEVCNGVDDNCNDAIDEGVANACGECGPDPEEVCDLIDNDCDGDIDEECVGGDVHEVEPNDSPGDCQPIAVPVVVDDSVVLRGVFAEADDVDSFCFHAVAGQGLIFSVDSVILGAPTNPRIELFDASDGSSLIWSDNGFAVGKGYDPYMEWDFLRDHDCRIEISNLGGTGGLDHVYELHVIASNPPGVCSDNDGDQVSPCDGDCDDADALVFPAQAEVCDGFDNNCDGLIDAGCPIDTLGEREPNNSITNCLIVGLPAEISGAINVQLDQDYYCFFVPKNTGVSFDIDAQEPPLTSELDSRLTIVQLSGQEIVSNDDGADPDTGFLEPHADSFVQNAFWDAGMYALRVSSQNPSVGSQNHTYVLRMRFTNPIACNDNDHDGVTPCEGDCNDNDPKIFWGNVEVCDNKDNNCDNVGDPVECTGDWDGDGFNGLQGDCDENDPAINPSAKAPNGSERLCDGFDNDCDGTIDDGVRNACGGCGHPPAEVCGNGIDDDCDGVIDTDCNVDGDGDGLTPAEGDCDDTRAGVYPAVPPLAAAVEVCDGIDNDCDGLVDEFVKNGCGTCTPPRGALIELCNGVDDDCNDEVDDGALNDCGTCGPPPIEVCDGIDNDCDGYEDEGVKNACGGCGPLTEACDGVDNDCDGIVDNGCDLDRDGDGVTPRSGDCNESSNTTYWGAPELCNGIDNDCDGWVDDDFALCPQPTESEANNTTATCDTVVWPVNVRGVLADLADRDHFCFTAPADITLGIDIDARDLNSPLDSEIFLIDSSAVVIDSNDNGTAPDDTMGTTSDSYISFDVVTAGTYFVRVGARSTASAQPMFYNLIIAPELGCLDMDRDGASMCDSDCDDFNAATNPGAIDVCDGADNNCDGSIDERCFNGCLDDLKESNDSIGLATLLPGPGVYFNLQMCGGDGDFYSFDAVAGQSMIFDVNQVDPLPMLITLTATDGFTPLVQSAPDVPTISHVLPASGRYAVGIVSPIGQNTAYEVTFSLTGP